MGAVVVKPEVSMRCGQQDMSKGKAHASRQSMRTDFDVANPACSDSFEGAKQL
jgi:hypothetical protein